MNPDNMKVTSGRDSNYKPGDVKGRPTDTKGSKDFKKILERASEQDEENLVAEELSDEKEADDMDADVQAESVKKRPTSLFDLSGSKSTAFDDNRSSRASGRQQADVQTPDSPSNLYGKLNAHTAAPKAPAKETDTEAAVEADLEADEAGTSPVKLAGKGEKVDFDMDIASVKPKDNFTTRFSTEQPDISYVNPLAAAAPNQASVNLSISQEKLAVPVTNIQAIINQMVDKVTEMKNTGSTDTIITLKQPPMFEGAKIIVTAFDSAKNEFNISIENLTQAGKQLMDQQSNRNNLLQALEQKGYAVHILSTTTLTETRVVDALPTEQREREQGNQQQGKKKRNQDEDA